MARIDNPLSTAIENFDAALARIGYDMLTPTAAIDSDRDEWHIVLFRRPCEHSETGAARRRGPEPL